MRDSSRDELLAAAPGDGVRARRHAAEVHPADGTGGGAAPGAGGPGHAAEGPGAERPGALHSFGLPGRPNQFGLAVKISPQGVGNPLSYLSARCPNGA